jgi:hypothetical protein
VIESSHLKPGGYVEIYEAELAGLYSDDNTYRPDSNIHKWMQHYCEACKLMGIPDPCTHLEKWVKEVGFEEVTVRKYKTPWGPWAKDKKLREIGRFMMLNCETAFEAYGLALLTRYCGKMAEEAKSLCEGARADVFNRNIHIYNYQYDDSQFPLRLELTHYADGVLLVGSQSEILNSSRFVLSRAVLF